MKYIIRDREAGNVIEECATLAEAEEILRQYEEEDKNDGNYTPDFYEIVKDQETATELMRKDLGLSRAAFSRKYNIPVRTLEAWESGDREAPDYVIDLLGRAVYSDMMNKKAEFYVVAIGEHDEWNCGKFDSYIKAFKEASVEWERRTPGHVLKVEIRLYVADVEFEDCDNFDYEIVSF